MADYAALAALALRLITENGRTVRVVKYGNNPQDQDQPWRGQPDYLEAEVSGPAAFVPKTMLVGNTFEMTGGVLKEGEYAIFPALSDGGYKLEQFDALVDNGITWRITKTELIAPGDTRIIYMFEVKR